MKDLSKFRCVSPTGCELLFLKYLGQWSIHKDKPQGVNMSRPELLRKYARAMKLRRSWGAIDKVKIREYLEKELGVFFTCPE